MEERHCCACGAPIGEGTCPRCKRLRTCSKYLSKHLRHQPAAIGLVLDPGGWVAVDTLLAALASHGFPLAHAELESVVASNNKQRFAFDKQRTRIRASQGHSVAVDLALLPVLPPAVLYHGTAEHRVAAILREGLHKMQRHHVHLSADVPTAHQVGARHGRPAILRIAAAAMHQAGYCFYCSANGVWLVAHVPPRYLRLLADVPAHSP
ncbi:MAG: RNA 2'-phosphotransferase [Blastochloris sp.]|nr:RNA 2'-phosphotransferase [Blastochloris sp.]